MSKNTDNVEVIPKEEGMEVLFYSAEERVNIHNLSQPQAKDLIRKLAKEGNIDLDKINSLYLKNGLKNIKVLANTYQAQLEFPNAFNWGELNDISYSIDRDSITDEFNDEKVCDYLYLWISVDKSDCPLIAEISSNNELEQLSFFDEDAKNIGLLEGERLLKNLDKNNNRENSQIVLDILKKEKFVKKEQEI